MDGRWEEEDGKAAAEADGKWEAGEEEGAEVEEVSADEDYSLILNNLKVLAIP